jgi:nucleoside-diphosphate-sugar epimerase
MATTPDFSVAGKHVLITGGTGGIGGAFAKAFLDHGAHVIVADRARTLLLNSDSSGSSRRARVSSVLIQPGAIAFTRMPSSANAMANDLVNETTPVLAALYAGDRGAPRSESPRRAFQLVQLALQLQHRRARPAVRTECGRC